MNHDECFEMNEQARAEADFQYIECACECGRFVDEFDPCKIDGRYFSDHCASNLTTLRMEGFINVASKTKKLK